MRVSYLQKDRWRKVRGEAAATAMVQQRRYKTHAKSGARNVVMEAPETGSFAGVGAW
jgi:hypothetical protein